jgi:hypothetical protein
MGAAERTGGGWEVDGVERILAFQRPGQYRPIGMDDSHGALIDLRIPTKHATADILDVSLNV